MSKYMNKSLTTMTLSLLMITVYTGFECHALKPHYKYTAIKSPDHDDTLFGSFLSKFYYLRVFYLLRKYIIPLTLWFEQRMLRPNTSRASLGHPAVTFA
jgi:hypothetical protein